MISLFQLHHIYAQSKALLNVSEKYLHSRRSMILKELFRLFNVLIHLLVYVLVIYLDLENITTLGLVFLMYLTLFISFEYRLIKDRKKAFTLTRAWMYIKTQYRFIKRIFKQKSYDKYESKLMKDTKLHKIIKGLTGEDIILYYIKDKRSFAFVRKNTKEGIKIYFNEHYLKKLTTEEVTVIILHEVGHKKNKTFLSDKWFIVTRIILFLILLEISIIMFRENYLASIMAFELILFFHFRIAVIINHIEENRADAYSKNLCKSISFFSQTLIKSYKMIKDRPESCLVHNILYERHPLIEKRLQGI